jgi:hypothetical protein
MVYFLMNMQRYLAILLSAAFLLTAVAALAEEGGEEKPKKPPEKPRPDSAISMVMGLPEVKEWKKWMEAHGHTLEVWGESVKSIDGAQCWEVGVGEGDKDGVKTWAYFCLKQTGLDIWVEGSSGPTESITYYPYEVWRKLCKPLPNSPGRC